jgi:group I intron endonuclease
MTRASGVYAIVHRESGKLYVGSAVDLKRRWREHRSRLCRNIHPSRRLQNAWNKHGENAFAFVVVRFCPIANLIREEQRWIDETGSTGRRGYNASPTAGSQLGMKHTAESRARIAAASRGRKQTPEHRAKVVAALNGRKHTPEHRANIASARRGVKHSPETIAKISASKRGSEVTPEHRAKLSAALKNRRRSPETIAKIRATKRANKRAGMAMVQGELFD